MSEDRPRNIVMISLAPTGDGRVGIAIQVANANDLSIALLALLRAVAGGDTGLPRQVQEAALTMLQTIVPGEDVLATPVFVPTPGGDA